MTPVRRPETIKISPRMNTDEETDPCASVFIRGDFPKELSCRSAAPGNDEKQAQMNRLTDWRNGLNLFISSSVLAFIFGGIVHDLTLATTHENGISSCVPRVSWAIFMGGIVFNATIIVHGCRHFFGFTLILLQFTLNIFLTTIYASSLTKTKAKGVIEQLCPAW